MNLSAPQKDQSLIEELRLRITGTLLIYFPDYLTGNITRYTAFTQISLDPGRGVLFAPASLLSELHCVPTIIQRPTLTQPLEGHLDNALGERGSREGAPHFHL